MRPSFALLWLAAACASPPAVHVAPSALVSASWSTTDLAIEGVPPERFLVLGEGWSLAPDLRVRFDDVTAHVIRVDGALVVRLDGPLAVGWHALAIDGPTGGVRVPRALEVVDEIPSDAEVEPSLADPDALDGRCARVDLVACWPFDDDVADHGRRGNDLTGASVVTDGRCASFDDRSSLSLEMGSTSFDTLSIVGWVKLDAFPEERAAIVDADGRFGLFVGPAGEIRCSIERAGSDWIIASSALVIGRWHHVACVGETDHDVLYVDGTVVAEGSARGAASGTGTTLRVGENDPDGGDQLLGSIDELRLFDAALASGEVNADAMRGRP